MSQLVMFFLRQWLSIQFKQYEDIQVCGSPEVHCLAVKDIQEHSLLVVREVPKIPLIYTFCISCTIRQQFFAKKLFQIARNVLASYCNEYRHRKLNIYAVMPRRVVDCTATDIFRKGRQFSIETVE